MSMNKQENKYQVVIIGGGPVGLLLGCRLHQLGISFRILEKRKEPISHSRSLGIHPVSLELFDQLEIIDRFLAEGIKIKRGLAFSDSRQIGEISFEGCPGPFRYILAIPQFKTERILEDHLNSLKPDALKRGTEMISLNEVSDHVELRFRDSGIEETVAADFVVGCDGKNSLVRKLAGISFNGTSYPDTYLMGDFSDNTDFGRNAVIFLPHQGLIESFPLDRGKRRWVVKTETYLQNPRTVHLTKRVLDRIGHDLADTENFMLSSFGVQKLVAESFAKGRIVLAGDAAHVVSPIGGQGMNLGWLDAWELAEVLKHSTGKPTNNWENLLQDYGEGRKKIAQKVIRRAEINMRLGRATTLPQIRNTLVWLMLNSPLERKMARLFTMRDLEKGFL